MHTSASRYLRTITRRQRDSIGRIINIPAAYEGKDVELPSAVRTIELPPTPKLTAVNVTFVVIPAICPTKDAWVPEICGAENVATGPFVVTVTCVVASAPLVRDVLKPGLVPPDHVKAYVLD